MVSKQGNWYYSKDSDARLKGQKTYWKYISPNVTTPFSHLLCPSNQAFRNNSGSVVRLYRCPSSQWQPCYSKSIRWNKVRWSPSEFSSAPRRRAMGRDWRLSKKISKRCQQRRHDQVVIHKLPLFRNACAPTPTRSLSVELQETDYKINGYRLMTAGS